jgi:glycosyltransferase involved in cell wall biosynthesis
VSAILVSHPHNTPVSVEVAAALARRDRLSCYATGVAFSDAGWTGTVAAALARWRPVTVNRVVREIPRRRLLTLPLVELGARAAASALAACGVELKSYDAIFLAHDAAVAALPWPRDTDAVYAYEDGALRTFRRAAREDLQRVWDLPTRHHLETVELWREEVRRWPDAVGGAPHREPVWKLRRKDAELMAATKVTVASSYVRRTLERVDVRVPVVVNPYGFPVEQFSAKTRAPSGPFTVLAVGAQDLPKGTPYLLEAWRRAALPDAELHLIGPMRLAKSFVAERARGVRHWPHLPRSELAARYAAADLLAFPTLGDGFGLVIQEAMCCATPVVTTPSSGGPECITDGVDGWIVPARDTDALVDRLRAAAADRDRLAAVGRAARARAERWTWREAGDALVRSLES